MSLSHKILFADMGHLVLEKDEQKHTWFGYDKPLSCSGGKLSIFCRQPMILSRPFTHTFSGLSFLLSWPISHQSVATAVPSWSASALEARLHIWEGDSLTGMRTVSMEVTWCVLVCLACLLLLDLHCVWYSGDGAGRRKAKNLFTVLSSEKETIKKN